jgi:hypothetical protein
MIIPHLVIAATVSTRGQIGDPAPSTFEGIKNLQLSSTKKTIGVFSFCVNEIYDTDLVNILMVIAI